MAMDRTQCSIVPVTHELLGIMLGVRRASVSEVLEPLQQKGLIRKERGSVTILDRSRLKAAACECYQIINDEFDRLLG